MLNRVNINRMDELQRKLDMLRGTANEISRLAGILSESIQKDQAELYIAQVELADAQKAFCQAKERFVLFGGLAGGGTLHALRIRAILSALEESGRNVTVLTDASNDMERLFTEPLRNLLPDSCSCERKDLFILPNGSSISCCYLPGGLVNEFVKRVPTDHLVFYDAMQMGTGQFIVLSDSIKKRNGRMFMGFDVSRPGPGAEWINGLFVQREFMGAFENETPEDYRLVLNACFQPNEKLLMDTVKKRLAAYCDGKGQGDGSEEPGKTQFGDWLLNYANPNEF